MISEADVHDMLESRDLIAIGAKADEVRRRLHGARTTFVRVFEIHVDAPPSSVPAGTSAGEFRIVGRPTSLETAVACVRTAVSLADGVPVTGFSLADVAQIGDGSSLALTCRALRDAGLDAIAEVPIDLMDEPAATVAVARQAGLLVPRVTVHSIRDSDRVSLVNRVRDLQNTVGDIRAFAPLPRVMSVAAPTTGYDDVKQVALARVVADNIPSIQVDWSLYGPKLAQFVLTTGADDVDAISAVDPGTLGTRRSPIEEIRGNIRSAALDPIERNARFEAIG